MGQERFHFPEFESKLIYLEQVYQQCVPGSHTFASWTVVTLLFIAADYHDFTSKISIYVVNGRELIRIDAIFGLYMKSCIDIVLRDFIRRFLIAENELVSDDQFHK